MPTRTTSSLRSRRFYYKNNKIKKWYEFQSVSIKGEEHDLRRRVEGAISSFFSCPPVRRQYHSEKSSGCRSATTTRRNDNIER